MLCKPAKHGAGLLRREESMYWRPRLAAYIRRAGVIADADSGGGTRPPDAHTAEVLRAAAAAT
jgi:hypothetical protein